MHHVFHPEAAKNFRPHVLKATRTLLRRFLEKPGDVLGHVRQYVCTTKFATLPLIVFLYRCSMSGEVIVAITYGLDVQPDNDPYIDTSEEAVHMLLTTLGSNLVDVLPILKHVPEWMPGAGFQTRAREAKRVAHKMLENPFKVAKDRIVGESLQLLFPILNAPFVRIAATTSHRSSHIAMLYLNRGLLVVLILKRIQSNRQQGQCILQDLIRQVSSLDIV
jgi:hypothetical protein